MAPAKYPKRSFLSAAPGHSAVCCNAGMTAEYGTEFGEAPDGKAMPPPFAHKPTVKSAFRRTEAFSSMTIDREDGVYRNMADPSPSLNAKWLNPLLADFDSLATDLFRNVHPVAKTDGTAVTELDTRASAMVKNVLRGLFPDAGLISEEETEPYLPDAAYQWVLDPIDGTASFARGYPVWGLGLGLMKDREPVAGCVSFPILRETFLYTDSGFYLNGSLFQPPPPPSLRDVENLLIGSGLHGITKLEKLKTHKLRNFGSSLYHIAAVAAGRAEAVILPRAYIWDIAPGLPFTRARGYVERYLDGSPFSLHDLFRGTPPGFKLEAPLVIGAEERVQEVIAALR